MSVRSHLTEVIHKLLLSKDPDALEKLESISLAVKAKHFDANQPGSKVRRAPVAPCALRTTAAHKKRRGGCAHTGPMGCAHAAPAALSLSALTPRRPSPALPSFRHAGEAGAAARHD